MDRIDFSKKFEELKNRQQTTKAKTYMGETIEKYLPYMKWNNETFESDIKLLFISASRYYKAHTHAEFVRLLDWVRDKNALHPRQVAKLFNKKPTPYSRKT